MTRNTKSSVGGVALAASASAPQEPSPATAYRDGAIPVGAITAAISTAAWAAWACSAATAAPPRWPTICSFASSTKRSRRRHRSRLRGAEDRRSQRREKVQAGCPVEGRCRARQGRNPAAAPFAVERLANAEAMTAAKLEAIKAVRPAAEKLYAHSATSKRPPSTTPRTQMGTRRWHRGGRHGGPDRGGADRGEGRGPDRGSDDGEPALP